MLYINIYKGTMYIDTTETIIVYTMPTTTPKTPNKSIETLFPQISKIGPHAINYTASNKCYLVLHGVSNEWNYQCRLIPLQLKLPTHHS